MYIVHAIRETQYERTVLCREGARQFYDMQRKSVQRECG